MFAFLGHPMFTDPWGSQQLLRFPDTSLGMPWGCDTRNTAEGLYGPRTGHRKERSSPEQLLSTPRHGLQGVSRQQQQQQQRRLRQQQGSRRHATAAHPEHAARKPKVQQHRHTPQQVMPQPSTSSASYTSYRTASDDTSEPMDVCCCPPTPTPTANTSSSSYSSAHSGSGSSSGSRCPLSPAQQRQATSKPAAAPAAARQQQQHAQACRNSSSSIPSMDPHTAATVIQTAWRMHRLARNRPAIKQLAAAANQLRSIPTQLAAATAAAAAAGTALSQKQYLELSEPVMKVLFLLDSVSCGPAVELRTIRKQLTTEANGLLDGIQAAYKSQPAAPAHVQQQQQPAVIAAQQQQQQQQQGRRQQRRPASSSSYQRLRRLAGYH